MTAVALVFRPGSADPRYPDETNLDWQGRAACLNTDPDLMFPDPDLSNRWDHDRQVSDAKRICGYCPVRRECLAYALANDEPFGIWGGMTRRDRCRIKRLAESRSGRSLAA